MIRLYTIFFLSFVFTQGVAQSVDLPDLNVLLHQYKESKPDSNQVKLLLNIGTFYLFKMGEEKSDLDSALLFAVKAEKLANKIEYTSGGEAAIFLTGEIYVEARNYPEVWKLLSMVSDSNGIKIMHTMVHYKLETEGREPADIDTAMYYAQLSLKKSQAIHSLSLTAKSYLAIAHCYFEKKDWKQGEAILQDQFDYCSSNGYIDGEIDNYIALVEFSEIDAVLLRKMNTCLSRLLNDYKKITNKSQQDIAGYSIESAMIDVAEALWEANQLDSAEKQYFLLISLAKKNDWFYPGLYPYTYTGLAVLYLNEDKPDKGLYYAIEGVRIVGKNGNKENNSRVYEVLGLAYSYLGKDELSVTNYEKALAISKLKNITDCSLIHSLGEAYLKMGEPRKALSMLQNYIGAAEIYTSYDNFLLTECAANCYVSMGQYDKAQQRYVQCVAFLKPTPYIRKLCRTYLHIADLYVKTGNCDKAAPWLQEALNIAVPEKYISYQRDAYYLLYKIDSTSKNYLPAIQHFLTYKVLADSVLNESKSKQINELEIQYETEKKDQNIKLLEKQGQLQEEGLKQTRLIRNGLLAGFVMLVLLLCLVYNRYRVKQKTNQLLELQQSEINQTNKELQQLNVQQQKLITEKEWLVKEIHHRVKNNLQIVISLLNAQSDFLDNPSALQAINESRERMQAIALIHQKLYQPDHGTTIDMRSYIQEMISYLGDSFSNAGRMHFNLDIGDIDMDISQAVPLGLLLNEAITNAVKYAFPDDRPGTIAILLHQVDDHNMLLKISDNGIGVAKDFDLQGNDSLGIQLMKLFAEQLDGELRFNDNNGVEVSLLFKQSYM